MAHQSWYRTYRPQSFDDVVGQTHIERTLRNAVEEDSVAHAYLFTGPRGTGKTSTARILAKALNCEQGPTGTPDDSCEDCAAIAAGTHPDVHELDAASRTGVDAVREEIIGRVNYAPTRGHWKVYIIDEVHMLSNAAFNALLKTLEEPPSHTVFILCTTHPHKVPETIHSRCQRFDFHRLSVEEIVSRLRFIADAEKVEVADAALSLIGKHALGGMRDAITTLEQLASFSGGKISLEDVEGLLGEVDAEVLFEAADLICDRDVAGAFRFVAELSERGVDMTEFVKGFVRHARDLFVVAAVPEAGEVVDVTAGDRTRLEQQARSFGMERLVRLLDVLDRLSSELRYASDQRLALEVALTRMARPETDLTLESLAERIAALESGAAVAPPSRPSVSAAPVSVSAASAPAAKPSTPAPAPSVPSETRPAPAAAPERQAEPEPEPVVPGGPLEVAAVKRAWPAIQSAFKKLRPSRSHLFDSSEIEVVGDSLVVEFAKDQRFALELASDPETVQLLRRSISSVLGVTPPVEFRLGRSGGSTAPAAAPASTPAPPAAVVSDAIEAPVATPLAAEDPAALERMLIDELGAEVVSEIPNDATEQNPEEPS
ncbi:MAG: DNA polymerase III subunit gamma/tau [Actinobacteria bacterium HGW-Actinobacteria-1]|nr:MAG: DNA polymerase III subunit gamma/tau [Actinobacteria bacterium HGW-Actinobacteria-1]